MSSLPTAPPAPFREAVIEAVDQGPEMAIRWPEELRLRTAASASGAMAAVLLPIGLIVGELSHSFALFGLLLIWSLLSLGLSYLGQRQNVVFVGPRGIRRVRSGCNLTVPWPELQELSVRVPGNRIVVLMVRTSEMLVESPDRRPSRQVRSMIRNPPVGLELRMERQGADLLAAAIGHRRPDLPGLADWETASRPAGRRGDAG